MYKLSRCEQWGLYSKYIYSFVLLTNKRKMAMAGLCTYLVMRGLIVTPVVLLSPLFHHPHCPCHFVVPIVSTSPSFCCPHHCFIPVVSPPPPSHDPSSLSLLCPLRFVVPVTLPPPSLCHPHLSIPVVLSSPCFSPHHFIVPIISSSLLSSHSHSLSFLYTPVIIFISTHNPSYEQWLVGMGVGAGVLSYPPHLYAPGVVPEMHP